MTTPTPTVMSNTGFNREVWTPDPNLQPGFDAGLNPDLDFDPELGLDSNSEAELEAGLDLTAGGASNGNGPPRPVVWAALPPDDSEYEWLRLNEWVEDLRQTFNLPASVIPPFWHRHQILVEHLSALRTHWLAAFDPEQHGSAPFGWIRDLDEWTNRIREHVSQLGCRLDACRPQHLAPWPGQINPDPTQLPPPINLTDRYDDFVTYVLWDVNHRRIEENHYLQLAANIDDELRQGSGASE